MIMICVWEPTGAGYVCTRCGWQASAPLHQVCRPIAGCRPVTARDLSCVQRGEYVRAEECAPCAGSVRIKVFACHLHGECTLATELSGAACCATCADYRARETQTPGAPTGT